jgi:perosamine synthetase
MIAVNEPLLDGNELTYVSECIRTGWISSEGPFVKRFETEFAQSCNRNFGVAVINGTAALQLAVEALELTPGDEVILPSFTIISCASALVRMGLVPVFVDCDVHTMNSTADQYEAAITPKTKALMVVHIYGLPVDMDPILALAKQHNLKLIEDAAEMIGQTYKGRPCGSFGDVSITSFYPNKHITTGEGGMVLCDEETLFARLSLLRNLAFIPPRRFVHEEFGWNYRMTNIQAALGVAQLENLGRNIEIKRRIGELYDQHLAGLKGASLPLPATDYAQNIYWVYTIVIDADRNIDADRAMAELARRGIGTRPFFWPMHQQPVLRRLFPGLEVTHLPVSEHLARKGFYIPSGLGLDLAQIPFISQAVRDVVEEL